MTTLAASELVCNADGSIYHLHLLPEHLAHTIILVGDPNRVPLVSRYFDRIEHQIQKREFVTHTGYVGKKRLSVVSTGIGTDNIDIVLNELDALVNIDLPSRTIKPEHTSLQFVRIGTSGALQPDIAPESFVASSFGLGFDGLLHFYPHTHCPVEEDILAALPQFPSIKPYLSAADNALLQKITKDDSRFFSGITVTCCGFYAPQGRQLRLRPTYPNLLDQLADAKLPHDNRVTNLEMETSGIYGLARLLGHKALSTNVILANRPRGEFSANPQGAMDSLIRLVLERLSSD